MTEISEIEKQFGNRLRVRVCGILIENDCVLLVKHKGLGEKGVLWSPPGGGVEYGISIQDNLVREFKEETGLIVKICDFLYASEFLNKPLHAIELFYEVKRVSGILKKGFDPELTEHNQIIEEVSMKDFYELKRMNQLKIHRILRSRTKASELLNRQGFLNF
jgi:8-oxo-dGTP diphosphatase